MNFWTVLLKFGQTLVGLLNAFLGNAVEAIVGISAWLRGYIESNFHMGRIFTLYCR